MKDIAIIMYSHSEYSDAWEMFFGQLEKHLHSKVKKYIFTDKDLETIPDDWQAVLYNNEDTYSKRVAGCLTMVDEEYCIFHHEDMPLFDNADLDKIEYFKKTLDKEDDLSYIKMVKGGMYGPEHQDVQYKDYDSLFTLNERDNFLFAVQPSIWKTKDLLKIYKITLIKHIREFETNATEICRYMNIKGLYYFGGEDKRGMFHWDSDAYPYICTAINKGKWNTSEYGKELLELFSTYSIDPSIRGEI